MLNLAMLVSDEYILTSVCQMTAEIEHKIQRALVGQLQILAKENDASPYYGLVQ